MARPIAIEALARVCVPGAVLLLGLPARAQPGAPTSRSGQSGVGEQPSPDPDRSAEHAIAQKDSARAVPPSPPLPLVLSLKEAMRIFRRRGLDLLIADAAVRSAEGQVKIAGAVPNPVVGGSVGNALTYSKTLSSITTNCYGSGAECSPWAYHVNVSDSAALEDSLSGKRDLRLRVARAALAAAKMGRTDAERTVGFLVKSAYVAVAQAELAYRFAKDVVVTQVTTLKKFQERRALGAINDGDMQRIEVQKLEADQALDQADQALRQGRVALAFLLGVRGEVPEFEVDTSVLDYSVPKSLQAANEIALLRSAFDHRPDLVEQGYLKKSAEEQIKLVKRQKFPDITLGVDYGWGGFGGYSTNGPIQGQALTFNISAPIPVFYALQGEQRQAEAQYDTNSLQEAKTAALVASDVGTAFAAFLANKALVERMEGPRRAGGGILQSAKGAFEILAIQYEKGLASLTDYLDALRTYIATKNEYIGDLGNYWTAVYQLEAAVGEPLDGGR